MLRILALLASEAFTGHRLLLRIPTGFRRQAQSCGARTIFLLVALLCFAPPDLFANSPPVLARVALISDTHTTRGTNEEQPHYKGRLDKVMAQVNAAKVDLVLITGDLTQNGKPEEIRDFKKQIEGFKARVCYVPGNHDVGNKRMGGAIKPDSVTGERVAAVEEGLGPSFFARNEAGLRIVGINSPLLGSGLSREKEMWMFLEKELTKPSRKPVVVFSHYPLFVKNSDEAGGDYWNIEPEPRRHLLDLLRQGGVKTVLSGHLHRDMINRYDGILFVGTRPVSFGLPKGKQPEGWTLVTVRKEGEAQVELKTIRD
jgi:3',5'-cyclic AMP phosphodiesterase CpdA